MSAAPTTENCRFCWMCRQVCPVGHVTARETLTPHAWALTIESVKRGQLDWNRETADVMYACADCGLCRAHCVTDQPLPDAIVAARAEIVRRGLAPPNVIEFENMLRAHPGAKRGTSPGAPVRTGASALFFGGQGRDQRESAVDAAITLLRAIGIDVFPICQTRASGLSVSALGLTESAGRMGRAVIEEVIASGARDLYVLTPADRWTFEYVYPQRLGIEWPDVAVHEVTEVLARALSDGRLTLDPGRADEPYAYHDPCHSPRLATERAAPRTLLAAVLGAESARELFWRGQRAHPCGATGGLEFTHLEIARRLADARIDDCERAGARVLFTEDPTCLAHLRVNGRTGVAVRGLYELLAQRLRP